MVLGYQQIHRDSKWGQHGAHLGPTGPRWAPCWPHELCYLGSDNYADVVFPNFHLVISDFKCIFTNQIKLTDQGQVTYICVSNCNIIASDHA